MHFRNNLILGHSARPAVFAVDSLTNYSSSDHNGFRSNPEAEHAFEWNSPPFDVAADFGGGLQMRRFATLAEYAEATGQDRNSIEVDFDVFRNAAPPDYTDPTQLYVHGEVDLRLREGSAPIDAGTVLPNITDGWRGEAPDLGAYQFGEEVPHYGPRPR